MIPYMVGKLAPNLSHLTRGLVKYVPGRGYFRAVSLQNGDTFVTSPPPQSLNGSKPLHGIQTGSPMVVTLGQQYNTGEKHTVVMLLVIGKEKIFTLYNESTEIFYDVYSETVVS